jgi:ATP-dependent Lon protease
MSMYNLRRRDKRIKIEDPLGDEISTEDDIPIRRKPDTRKRGKPMDVEIEDPSIDESASIRSSSPVSEDLEEKEDSFVEDDEDSDDDSDVGPKIPAEYDINHADLAKNIYTAIEECIKPDDRFRVVDLITSTLKTISKVRLMEYKDLVPKDEKWKLGLSPAEIESLLPTLLATRQSIKDEEPTMEKILSAPMTMEERKYLLQLYDVYQNVEPYSEDAMNVRAKLVSKLKTHQKNDEEKVRFMSEEEKRISPLAVDRGQVGIKERILHLAAPDAVKSQLLDMYESIKDNYDAEGNQATKDKIELALGLPYGKISTVSLPPPDASLEEKAEFCAKIRARLDAELYGMENVKDEIITILNNRISNPRAISTVALKGRPGVGKTAIVECLAKALDYPFKRVALGGLQDSTELKGSSAHWVGSAPSAILKFLKSSGVSNGIILFDELDKLSLTKGGREAQNALLHIADYTQNHEFQDGYLPEFSHDISKLWFFYSLNDENEVDAVLRDRLDIVEVSGYKKKDLKNIITLHLLPRTLEELKFPEGSVSIDDKACDEIIEMVAGSIAENGVRPIAKAVRTMIGRLNLVRTNGVGGPLKIKHTVPNFSLPYTITPSAVNKLLDRPKRDTIPDIYS